MATPPATPGALMFGLIVLCLVPCKSTLGDKATTTKPGCPSGPVFASCGLRFFIKLPNTQKEALFIARLLVIVYEKVSTCVCIYIYIYICVCVRHVKQLLDFPENFYKETITIIRRFDYLVANCFFKDLDLVEIT